VLLRGELYLPTHQQRAIVSVEAISTRQGQRASVLDRSLPDQAHSVHSSSVVSGQIRPIISVFPEMVSSLLLDDRMGAWTLGQGLCNLLMERCGWNQYGHSLSELSLLGTRCLPACRPGPHHARLQWMQHHHLLPPFVTRPNVLRLATSQ